MSSRACPAGSPEGRGTAKMRIWLITIGEPLPMDGPGTRLLRTGILAGLLAEQGHDVVWWSSTFDHARKRQRHSYNIEANVKPNYKIVMLQSVAYEKNVSIRRMINHFELGKKFSLLAKSHRRPDVILCSFPTIELGIAAVAFGGNAGVPVVMDVRDLWPDIYLDRIPRIARVPGRLALHWHFAGARRAFTGASAVVGVSEGYLKWGLEYAGRARGEYDEVFPLGYSLPDIPEEDIDGAGRELMKKGVDPSKMICWFSGTFGKTAGLECVMDAARRMQARGAPRLQFVFSGDGENREKLSRMAEGLGNVVFTGWMDAPGIRYMMRVAGIGLAAYAENAPQGLPNKLYEYMSAGLPVLSSLRGEAEELLEREECGLTYKGGCVDSLFNNLVLISRNARLRSEMGENARRLFTRSFSAERVYPRMAGYLADVARANTGRAFSGLAA